MDKLGLTIASMHDREQRKAYARNLRRLWRSADGVGAIEFAMVAPFLAFLAMGVVDISRGIASAFTLQQAVDRGIELAVVGTRDADLENVRIEGAKAAGIPLAQAKLEVWLECNGTKMPSYDQVCEQLSARFLKLELENNFRPTFVGGPLTRLIPAARRDGTIPFKASATVRLQ
jgi:Flp pilus assembly pilin Flp